MASIVFYEKSGCANNARQKLLLKAAGHEVITRNLLGAAWTADSLRVFFCDLPVREWFNRAAPRVKSGEVVPELLDADAALTLMLADPLLIRRPLMECGGRRFAGFDARRVEEWLSWPSPHPSPGGRGGGGKAWIELPLGAEVLGDLQTCHRDRVAAPCPEKDHPPLPPGEGRGEGR